MKAFFAMKTLKKSGNYLRKKAIWNLSLGIICLIGFITIMLTMYPMPLYIDVGEYAGPRALVLFSLLFLVLFFLRKFSNYRSGSQGEHEISKVLSSALNDDYHLINDVALPDAFGNIDHIVLGPNGIFVIETKNWRGEITCIGDKWSRQYKIGKRRSRRVSYELKSPSKQVKGNAVKVRELVKSLEAFKSWRIWVEALVVFTHRSAVLHVNWSTVPIRRVSELASFIMTRKPSIMYSSRDIELIGEEIMRQHCP